MAANFHACPSCARHIKLEEAACPFCGAATPDGFANLARPRGPAALSRAAILFVSATAAAGVSAATACSSSSPTPAAEDSGGPVAAYGPGPVHDSGSPTDSGGVIDSGGQIDSGGPVAAYGPAIIDSGMDTSPGDSGDSGEG